MYCTVVLVSTSILKLVYYISIIQLVIAYNILYQKLAQSLLLSSYKALNMDENESRSANIHKGIAIELEHR